jgi:hypothetical protein
VVSSITPATRLSACGPASSKLSFFRDLILVRTVEPTFLTFSSRNGPSSSYFGFEGGQFLTELVATLKVDNDCEILCVASIGPNELFDATVYVRPCCSGHTNRRNRKIAIKTGRELLYSIISTKLAKGPKWTNKETVVRQSFGYYVIRASRTTYGRTHSVDKLDNNISKFLVGLASDSFPTKIEIWKSVHRQVVYR